MFTTILNIILAAFGVHLSMDGFKQHAEDTFNKMSRTTKIAVVAFLSLVATWVLGRFIFPHSFADALIFLAIALAVFLVAGGFLRLFQRLSPTTTKPV